MNVSKRILTASVSGCLIGAAIFIESTSFADGTAELPPPAAKEGVTFDADILPLLERSCTKCHGVEKQKGKLRLDSLEATLNGARGEKIVVDGNSAESQLVLAISHATDEEDEWMPPEGKGDDFTSEEIALVRAWIDQGLK